MDKTLEDVEHEELKKLIKGMLIVNPEKRLSIIEALKIAVSLDIDWSFFIKWIYQLILFFMKNIEKNF